MNSYFFKKSLSKESYRSLRTNVQYSSVDKKLKTIIITSSIPGEGKSTVAINLAISMSEMNQKVLLIDADLRKPTLHKKMKLSNQVGLTDGIVCNLSWNEVIQKINNYLHVIPSGKIPPNPAEIIGSKAMDNLLDRLKEEYDYIIIDTPPVLSVTDPQLLAVKVDGTLLVVRERVAQNKLVLSAYQELLKVQANVIGKVLNDCKEKMVGYSKYYYEEKKHR